MRSCSQNHQSCCPHVSLLTYEKISRRRIYWYSPVTMPSTSVYSCRCHHATSNRPWPASPTICRGAADVDELTTLVRKIEATPGILSDWSLHGAHTEAAAFEIWRTVCRRAERQVRCKPPAV